MGDFAFIGMVLGFVVLSLGLIAGCQRLMGGEA